jgi:Cu+-exporting ATPase
MTARLDPPITHHVKHSNTEAPALRQVELAIGGMTCASCSARIERKLNRMDGVSATVNLVTELAQIQAAPGVSDDDLIGTVEATGYTAARTDLASADADSPADGLRPRLITATLLSVPVLLVSMLPTLQFRGWQWLALALTTPVVTWAGWPFHRAAAINARHAAATMDTLVSIGVIAAYTWSLWALLFGGAGELGMRMSVTLLPGERGGGGPAELYLEIAGTVTTFLLAGRYLEARARRSSGAALRALLDLGAKQVSVLRGSVEIRVPVESLQVGDRFVVRPGERIGTDGEVLEGESDVDESMLTGEPLPVPVGPGSVVTGSCLNGSGRLIVRATRVGGATRLAQIARLVQDAQSGKAPVQRLADQVSAVFVPVVLVLAALTLAGWLLATGDPQRAFTAAVAVLIIACPCALGLATPTALLVGTGRGAQLGILIRGPEVLERARRIDVVLLDKTGTLTEGRMSLVEVGPAAGEDAGQVLRRAAAVEGAGEHPLGQAIAAAGLAESGSLPAVSEFRSVHGLGVVGVVDGVRVTVGRPGWGSAVPAGRIHGSVGAGSGVDPARVLPGGTASAPELAPEPAGAIEAAERLGHTAVLVSWGDRARGVLTLSDTIKPGSPAAIAELQSLGLRPVLLTGDNPRAAAAVAATVGIAADDVIAGVLPEGKVDAVTRLQREGRTVAMVGDGVNDAAALAAADLGIALGTGTDVAIEAGDVTLLRGEIGAVPQAVRLSRATLRTIRQNLGWAFGYNLAALPLAGFGLLNPLIAGLAMALSSVAVVSNSLRLRRFDR